MFFTQRLMIRNIDPEVDLKTWLQWTNDEPIITNITLQGPQPWSRERTKKFLESRASDADALPCFMISKKPQNDDELPAALGQDDDLFRTADGKSRYPAIGNLNLRKASKDEGVNGTVVFGVLLDKRHQDQGLGTELLRWMCEYVFTTLGYRRIELDVDATNARAIRVYQKIGFVQEGRRRKRFWRDGEWRDLLAMALLKEEWSQQTA